MSPAADFHSQIASIMEVLANAAVTEICKVVDDGYALVQLDMSRSLKESEFLRRKITLLELQLARCRAERGRTAEGPSRFTGVRLLRRQARDSTKGPAVQGQTRFLNRGPPQPVQKTLSIILDQDPDQEVVTTTKTESTDHEEGEQHEHQEEEHKEEEGHQVEELLIVKVEGSTDIGSTNQDAPLDISIPTLALQDSVGPLSAPEVSGSDAVSFVVSSTPETSSRGPAHNSLSTGSSARALAADTPHRDCLHASCVAVTGDRNSEEVIVIDGGGDLHGAGVHGAWPDHMQTSGDTHERTTFPIIHCAGQASGPALPPGDQPGTYRAGSAPGVSLHRPGPSPHLAFFHAATMERPYACSRCSKRFFLPTDLQRHAARHIRQKPYTCSLCGKSFVCQSQLDVHRHVHTGARPFTCSVCSRRFSHPSNLRRHLKVQH